MVASLHMIAGKCSAKPASRLAAVALAALLAIPRLSGFQHLGQVAIPPSAPLRDEGNGKLVAYTTDTRGNAYVYDATEAKLLWSGKVDRQQSVAVDTEHNAITVDGKPVHTRNVPNGHKYRVYFEPRDQ